MAAKDELGRRGEDIAAAHLVASGMTVVERNWRCEQGEIDVALGSRFLGRTVGLPWTRWLVRKPN